MNDSILLANDVILHKSYIIRKLKFSFWFFFYCDKTVGAR